MDILYNLLQTAIIQDHLVTMVTCKHVKSVGIFHNIHRMKLSVSLLAVPH